MQWSYATVKLTFYVDQGSKTRVYHLTFPPHEDTNTWGCLTTRSLRKKLTRALFFIIFFSPHVALKLHSHPPPLTALCA